MPSNNKIIIASAGSGKTEKLISAACSDFSRRCLITTYTINNLEQIRNRLVKAFGIVPPHIHLTTWYSFLLNEAVRPYQNFLLAGPRIRGICFEEGRSTTYKKRADTERFYLTRSCEIYSDTLSDFAYQCDIKSRGLVIKRLKDMYDHVFIDEMQDMAGYDFDFLISLLKSGPTIYAVGDIRQRTYTTNHSPRNRQYEGENLLTLYQKWQKADLCEISNMSESFRCNQPICDIADSIYPNLPPTKSKNLDMTGHDGVFVISANQVDEYMRCWDPIPLRFDKNTECNFPQAMNFGESKGLTFERVVIFSNGPICKALANGRFEFATQSAAKIYVAITRAKHSVAFVFEGKLGTKLVTDLRDQINEQPRLF